MAQDIIIDETDDLMINNGDFVIENSDVQHAVLIINTQAGSWKQYPTCGVGIIRYSASSGKTADLKREITVQLSADGFVNPEVTLIPTGDYYDYYINGSRLD